MLVTLGTKRDKEVELIPNNVFEQLDGPFVIKLFKTWRDAGLKNYYLVQKAQFNGDIASNVIKQLSRYYARADWLRGKHESM